MIDSNVTVELGNGFKEVTKGNRIDGDDDSTSIGGFEVELIAEVVGVGVYSISLRPGSGIKSNVTGGLSNEVGEVSEAKRVDNPWIGIAGGVASVLMDVRGYKGTALS